MAQSIEVIDLLLKEGLITPDMLAKAKEEAKRTGLNLERALQKLGFIRDEDVIKVRAAAMGIPYMDLSDYLIDAELTKLLPENAVKRYKAVPLFKIHNSLTVGMVDPQDIIALDQIRRITQAEMIEPVLVSEKGIQAVLDSHYRPTESVEEIVKSINKEKIQEAEKKGLSEVAEEAPIIKLVNVMIAQAVKERASDIHIEPEEEKVRVRYRVDGLLAEVNILPKKLQNAVISRLKILAKMDIAENRKPQDGRIRLKVDNKDLDIRVSTFPTVNGENVVMRLLDRSSVLLGLK
ncbi:MAG: ATPase, T2SS/T4P/T4SS family, partial [Candidatus Omnitrophota bacterium]